jgi:hypothetical protein
MPILDFGGLEREVLAVREPPEGQKNLARPRKDGPKIVELGFLSFFIPVHPLYPGLN